MKKGGIDWDKTRRQLEMSRRALESALQEGPEKTGAVLRKRALDLSARRRVEEGGGQEMVVQQFSWGGRQYALPLEALLRLAPMGICTRVPGAEPEVLGLVNFQGEIRLVLELGLVLGQDPAVPEQPGYLLLCKNEGHPLCLRVEELGPVRTLAEKDLETPGSEEFLAGNCARAVARDGLIILDEKKLHRKIRPDLFGGL